MNNKELAKIFYQISQHLRSKNIPFKPQAYNRAATTLNSLNTDVEKIYAKGGLKVLEAMPGIGKNIALKIKEYLETGKIQYFEDLKIPVDLTNLTKVQGIGWKKANLLYQKLNIKNLKELERAVKENKVKELPGFDKKTEKNIEEGITFLKQNQEKFLLLEAFQISTDIIEKLEKYVLRIDLAGSARRKKETVKDIDLLAAAQKPEQVMNFFTSQKGVKKIWGKGNTRASIKTKEGINVDLRIVPLKSYGAAWQYFTGSREHNIVLRKRAKQKGFKLNEYGLFQKKKKIAGKSEKEIYQKLDLDFIPPEIRETGIEIKKKIPKLVKLDQIKGDLHCHTNWSDGQESLERMYEKAQKLGYQYLGISDHTKFLRAANGLNEGDLIKQAQYIKRIKQKGCQILQGCEANILADGSLDIDQEVLNQLDFVIAGIHSGFSKDITERVLKAMENPAVKIISHLTGRLIKERKECLMNLEKILEKAKQTNTILEINASPKRLDLPAEYVFQAKQKGVKMIINTDAHLQEQLDNMCYGVFQARRGWLEKNNVCNTLTFPDLKNLLYSN